MMDERDATLRSETLFVMTALRGTADLCEGSGSPKRRARFVQKFYTGLSVKPSQIFEVHAMKTSHTKLYNYVEIFLLSNIASINWVQK